MTLKTPPVAEPIAHRIEKHGHTRTDPYFWLRERESPKVLAYLRAENSYTEEQMRPTEEFQKKLFAEMKRRIKEDDSSVPEKDGEYYYYRRFEPGKEYPIHCRKYGSVDAQEQIILDGNELAKSHSYFSIGSVSHSFDHNILAYAVDTVGRRIHTIYFKDLKTGKTLDDKINDVTGNMAWANDNKNIFYSRQNLETLRSDRVLCHTLGSTAPDRLIYEEKEETFGVAVSKSSSKRLIIIDSYSTITTEARFIDAFEPLSEMKVFLQRSRGHEYSIDEAGDRFLILTNDQAKNFKLMEASFDSYTKSDWKVVVPHREDTLLYNFRPFKTTIVLQERFNGLSQIRLLNRKTGTETTLSFDDPVYTAAIGSNREFDTNWFRFSYESLNRPETVFDYNMESGEKIRRKQREVPGFSADLYESKRLFARAADGVAVPISLVSRKDTPKSVNTPCMIYGYGSYGLSMDPHFSSVWLSLLDRGFIVAVAHIRGGSEMGRHWYEDGRQLKKKNTFNDFIVCTEYLIQQGFTSASHLYAMGGSAGGLLMGAVINQRPELYKGVVAEVPFVDVITTMLDDSIPLTTGEYDEWGNPNEKPFYDYILSYSPYDNVKPQAYPHLLITTGLHDSQVQYWEPAKWTAKLRTAQKGEGKILLWTDMEAGHGGKSGRFNRLHEQALVYAFFLDLEAKLT